MTIGFIGLGRMGGPICRHLIEHGGEPVVVFDRDPAAIARCTDSGASAAASIAELAATARVIFTSLRMPSDVEEVVLGEGGIATHARPQTTYIDLTSNSPGVIRTIAAELAGRQVATLDAPVTGGPSVAESGRLGVLVGGDESVFAAHRALLELFADHVVYFGAVGGGMVAKLINNMISIANVAVAAEGMMLGAAAGLEVEPLSRALIEGDGDSLVLRGLTHALSTRNFASTFGLALAYKDVHLALELADELGVPAPCAAVSHNLLRMARGMGFEQGGATSLVRVYEETLGRRIGEPPPDSGFERAGHGEAS